VPPPAAVPLHILAVPNDLFFLHQRTHLHHHFHFSEETKPQGLLGLWPSCAFILVANKDIAGSKSHLSGKIQGQMALFVLVYAVCWAPNVVSHLESFIFPDCWLFWLGFLQNALSPAQGKNIISFTLDLILVCDPRFLELHCIWPSKPTGPNALQMVAAHTFILLITFNCAAYPHLHNN